MRQAVLIRAAAALPWRSLTLGRQSPLSSGRWSSRCQMRRGPQDAGGGAWMLRYCATRAGQQARRLPGKIGGGNSSLLNGARGATTTMRAQSSINGSGPPAPMKRRANSSETRSFHRRGSTSSSSSSGRGSTLAASSAPEDPEKQYRLEFGKHRGSLLSQIPESYIEWLVRERVYSDRPNLQKALVQAGKLTEHTEDAGKRAQNDDTAGPERINLEAQDALGWKREIRGADLRNIMPEDWKELLGEDQLYKKYWGDLGLFLSSEIVKGETIYPPYPEVFKALSLCSVNQTKVVILGQDPYHGEGQAEGLAFSVKEGIPLPSSLQNIFKELSNDIPGFTSPGKKSGSLTHWASQGVLLLNSALTVSANQANSHQKKGWEELTSAIIDRLSESRENLVFLVWGRNAQQRAVKIDRRKHIVLTSAHPSGLSANRGFFGCRHFSKANEFLVKCGRKPIDWNFPSQRPR